eukprot:11150052-Alexandrium_andersonii.AAC.1
MQSAIRLNQESALRKVQNRFRRAELELRTQERPHIWYLKLPMGAFCVVLRADSDSADEDCDRG